MTDAALDAYKGEEKFKGNKVPLRTLMILYPNRMHVVTVEGTGINKIGDLKGKRVSTGSPGSATEVMAFRVIEAAGLDRDKDMTRERLGVAESVNAIKDKQDRRVLLGGRPADRGGHRPRQHAGHDGQDDRSCRTGAGDEQEVGQPIRTGRDSEGHLQGHGVRQQAGHRDEHPGRAREDGRQDRLQHREDHLRQARGSDQVHKEAANFKLENQKAAASPIPFHPGAVKYFSEKGVKLN